MTTRRRLLALTAALALRPPFAADAQPATAPHGRALAAADQALVDKAVAYLQGLAEAQGRFVQTDGRGATTQGELFLKRPGKARFAYDPPSGLLVVSDGGRVIVQDKRLNTFTAYPLGATPLSLFLAKTIRLDKGVAGDPRRPRRRRLHHHRPRRQEADRRTDRADLHQTPRWPWSAGR